MLAIGINRAVEILAQESKGARPQRRPAGQGDRQASAVRRDHLAARGPLWPLCEDGRHQRHPAEVDRTFRRHRRTGDGSDRRPDEAGATGKKGKKVAAKKTTEKPAAKKAAKKAAAKDSGTAAPKSAPKKVVAKKAAAKKPATKKTAA